jgi:hypothetical protein
MCDIKATFITEISSLTKLTIINKINSWQPPKIPETLHPIWLEEKLIKYMMLWQGFISSFHRIHPALQPYLLFLSLKFLWNIIAIQIYFSPYMKLVVYFIFFHVLISVDHW